MLHDYFLIRWLLSLNKYINTSETETSVNILTTFFISKAVYQHGTVNIRSYHSLENQGEYSDQCEHNKQLFPNYWVSCNSMYDFFSIKIKISMHKHTQITYMKNPLHFQAICYYIDAINDLESIYELVFSTIFFQFYLWQCVSFQSLKSCLSTGENIFLLKI